MDQNIMGAVFIISEGEILLWKEVDISNDFKKTHDQKAHLKRKFKYKPKPIPQIKNQVVVQDPEARPGPTTQTYREEQTIIQSNINQKKYAPENHFDQFMK
ncbi:3555_t:CDS:2 [Racocetra persica]|uniref:3555_t:CDS:1 n=1 Tax=Racocetra persica TaxID=160502 RepID=A0ACA9L2Y0_9GLOM|nr:3555_t:CDS:2 [Racocetra persica]